MSPPISHFQNTCPFCTFSMCSSDGTFSKFTSYTQLSPPGVELIYIKIPLNIISWYMLIVVQLWALSWDIFVSQICLSCSASSFKMVEIVTIAALLIMCFALSYHMPISSIHNTYNIAFLSSAALQGIILLNPIPLLVVVCRVHTSYRPLHY